MVAHGDKPDIVFERLLTEIKRFVEAEERKGRRSHEIFILSPFLDEKFVRRFIQFVSELKASGYNVKQVIDTRSLRFIDPRRRDNYERAVVLLLAAGIEVRVVNREPFHGKAVIVDGEYIIAGSVNPLAPSWNETPVKMELKLYAIINPDSARNIVRLFKMLTPVRLRLSTFPPLRLAAPTEHQHAKRYTMIERTKNHEVYSHRRNRLDLFANIYGYDRS